MKIHIYTTSAPVSLWNEIKKFIKEDKIKTWRIIIHDGQEYLTHSSDQWDTKALLKYSSAINPNRLMFDITWYANNVPDHYTKGLYFGRFTEQLLTHFSNFFSKIETYP